MVALAAFVVDRSRAAATRDTTARIMLLALVPAHVVIVQPDLGSGLVYIVSALAMLFVGRPGWRTSRRCSRWARSRSCSCSWSRRRWA